MIHVPFSLRSRLVHSVFTLGRTPKGKKQINTGESHIPRTSLSDNYELDESRSRLTLSCIGSANKDGTHAGKANGKLNMSRLDSNDSPR